MKTSKNREKKKKNPEKIGACGGPWEPISPPHGHPLGAPRRPRVEWVNLHELNDEFAIFKAWPSEQNRVAATHLLAVPELKWAKEEGGLFYLARSEYDLACGQV